MNTNHRPNIYIYNPTCDYAIASNSITYTPKKHLSQMESDLSLLPIYYALERDYVISNCVPSDRFLSTLANLGIRIPHIVSIDEMQTNAEFIHMPKDSLMPWGWSPHMHNKLQHLKSSCSSAFNQSPVAHWQPNYQRLYSKAFAANLFFNHRKHINDDAIIPYSDCSCQLSEKADLDNLNKKWGNLMVKANWSSSGRGLNIVNQWPIHPSVWKKIESIINQQGAVLVEPFHSKVFDFTYQFKIIQGQIKYLGISHFITNNKGQYLGSSLNWKSHSLDNELKCFYTENVERLIPFLMDMINGSELIEHYEGKLGIDAMIYRDKFGALKINPCIEINLRHSMGYLSLHLEKLIHPSSQAQFQTWYGMGTLYTNFCKKMTAKYPLIIHDRKIVSGFFSLTDSMANSQHGAYVLATKEQ